MKAKDYEDKLHKIVKNNPDFAPVLTETFPQLKERDEKFHEGTKPLFMMRDGHKGNLYCLKYKDSSTPHYVIMNITTMQEWATTHPATHPFNRDPFITVQQFKCLLKSAGVKYEDMMTILSTDLESLFLTLKNRKHKEL